MVRAARGDDGVTDHDVIAAMAEACATCGGSGWLPDLKATPFGPLPAMCECGAALSQEDGTP